MQFCVYLLLFHYQIILLNSYQLFIQIIIIIILLVLYNGHCTYTMLGQLM